MAVTASGVAKRSWKELVRLRLRLKPKSTLTLTDLANIYRSDKGDLWYTRHGYTHVYERYFGPLRHQPLTLLEIGLRFHPFYRVQSAQSPSLQMWLDYFPHACVCGFDINEFSDMGSPRVRIFRGDQGNVDDLARVTAEIPAIDIIVDDGSHASYHQRVSLTTLLPSVKPGGLYIIEDLQWQPPDLEAQLPATETMWALLHSETFLGQLGLVREHVEFPLRNTLAVIRKPA